jgi:hypothetical protein
MTQLPYAGKIPHMSNVDLIARIEKRLERVGLTIGKACSLAEVDSTFLRDLKRNPLRSPRVNTLAALAIPLKTTPAWLAYGVGDEEVEDPEAIAIRVHADLVDVAKRLSDASPAVRNRVVGYAESILESDKE